MPDQGFVLHPYRVNPLYLYSGYALIILSSVVSDMPWSESVKKVRSKFAFE